MARFINKESIQKLWDKSGIPNLEQREKYALLGGIAFLLVFLLFRFAIVPLVETKSNLEKSTERKKQELVKIQELQKQYFDLKDEEGSIQAKISERGTGFSLFTFLDQQAEKMQVKKQIKYMKPSVTEGEDTLNESMVEMKFQQITLQPLVGFLRLIESEENVVFIKRISIQENGSEEGALDAILQIVTFEERQ